MQAQQNNDGTIPVPIKYLDYQGYWDSIDNGKLALQKCGKCNEWCHVPQPICPNCQSLDRKWEAVSGKGTVYSWVTYNESSNPAFKAPYSVVLVELAEGLRLISNLVDVKPDEIEIGMKVEVVYEKVSDELTLPKFKKV